MRIQHNISALNAANNMKTNSNAISKNIAKLSSGYRINSAADDAAGLAVSEKMRSQINGLQQAESNAENGISLVQTAEGGLNETSSILQRMNTLAVESANGTYQNTTDRANLQKEVTALQDEVNRISTSTNFNQINLLDGTLGSDTSTLKATVELSSKAKTAGAFTFTDATVGTFTAGASTTNAVAAGTAAGSTPTEFDYNVSYTDQNGATKTVSVALELDGATGDIKDSSGNVLVTGGMNTSTGQAAAVTSIGDAVKAELDKDTSFSSTFNTSVDSTTGSLVYTTKAKGSDEGSINNVQVDDHSNGLVSALSVTQSGAHDAYEGTDVSKLSIYDASNPSSTVTDSVFTVNGQAFAFVTKGGTTTALNAEGINTVVLSTTGGTMTAGDAQKMADLINSKTGLTVQAHASGSDFDLEYISQTKTTSDGALSLQIGSDNKADQRASLSIGDMSCKGLGIQNVSVATQQDAQKAIDTIKAAINKVDGTRADLGALQNELEHTSNNLSTMNQNLTSAESNIRDVDMSDEYVQYSKNQILSQAAQSMLAQANTQPQGILTLLRG